MKILFYQNYSDNNKKLFDLTIQNHRDYCDKHGYQLYTDDKPYSPYIVVNRISEMLAPVDCLITIGSDCLFTNMDMGVQGFIPENGVAVCEEGSSWTKTNGEILIFRKGLATDVVLLCIDNEQNNYPNEQWGTQSILNSLLNREFGIAAANITLIPAGNMQTYIPHEDNELNKKYRWKKGDYICHAIGGTNETKYDRMNAVLKEISQK